MLRITIPKREFFDEANDAFITVKEQTLQLEHSLVSLSRWESKWHKPFLSRDHRTAEESLDYVRCMTITQNVNPLIYSGIDNKLFEEIKNYIDEPMTATWFNQKTGGAGNQRIVTAELIYYWMFSMGIPLECEKWHLNRLLTLIKVHDAENSPKKKMSKSEIYAQNKALNAARLKAMGVKG